MPVDDHLSTEQLVNYFGGELAEHEIGEVDEHLGLCDACAERARRLSLLTEEWTPELYGEALQRDRYYSDPLVKALQHAATVYGEFRARVEQWLDGPEALWGAITAVPVGVSPVGVKGTRAELPRRFIIPPGQRRARIEVPDAQAVIEIALDPSFAFNRAPLVAIIREDDPDSMSVVALLRDDSRLPWIARIENLSAGSYLLAVEPT